MRSESLTLTQDSILPSRPTQHDPCPGSCSAECHLEGHLEDYLLARVDDQSRWRCYTLSALTADTRRVASGGQWCTKNEAHQLPGTPKHTLNLAPSQAMHRLSDVSSLPPGFLQQCLASMAAPARIAFVARGLIFKEVNEVLSTGHNVIHPVTHDFLRAWPSMRDSLVLPARGCGYDVDVYVAMHHNARQRMTDEYIYRLNAIDSHVTLWTSSPEVADTQFGTAEAFLRHLMSHLDGSSYSLVIMTRDDFLYDLGSWTAVANLYRWDRVNFVSTDCNQNSWDGLHLFPGCEAGAFADALSGVSAHRLHTPTGQASFTWFHGRYGQPDMCRPAMGELDRGSDQLITTRYTDEQLANCQQFGMLAGHSQQSTCDGCCDPPYQELRALADTRRCPVLWGGHVSTGEGSVALTSPPLPSPSSFTLSPRLPANGIAICMTGRIDNTVAQTVSNTRSALIVPLERVAEVAIFIYVKGRNLSLTARSALSGLAPRALDIYEEEEPPGPQGWRKWAFVAWLQRYQWQGCWEQVERAEHARSRLYEFVVRTRLDLLFDATRFRPDEWALWGHGDGRSGQALCKCHLDFLTNPSAFPAEPIIDAFMVAPRRVAAVFMTTWTRRTLLGKAELRVWSTRAHCARRGDQDLHECLTLYDLSNHGFNLSLVPEMQSLQAYHQHKWTHVYFQDGQCEDVLSGSVDGWTIYHRLSSHARSRCNAISPPH